MTNSLALSYNIVKMDNTVIVALISSGGSVLVAVTALLLNAIAGSLLIDARLEPDAGSRYERLLNKTMTAIEVDVARLKDKVGL